MIIYRFSAVFLLLAGCAASPVELGRAEPEQARAIGEEFCAAAGQRDEARAERLMTSALRAAIADLRRFDSAWRARNPGHKPPLADGLRLTAFPDSARSCVPEAATSGGVTLVYRPKGSADGAWKDRLILVRAPDGRLLVSDIRYDGAVGGALRSWITEARRTKG